MPRCLEAERENLGEFLRLAVPTALGNGFEYLPVCFGMAMVGHFEGPEALAAVALARAYFNVSAMAVGFGLLSALRTLCPQAVGAGRPELCATYVQRAALVVIAGGIPCCAAQFVSGAVLRAVGQPARLASLAQPCA
jgi:MATE family multidrug resistance protein